MARGGFPRGGGNMGNMMKQMQKMQKQLEETQKMLEEKEIIRFDNCSYRMSITKLITCTHCIYSNSYPTSSRSYE